MNDILFVLKIFHATCVNDINDQQFLNKIDVIHKLNENELKLIWFFDIIDFELHESNLRECMIVFNWWSDLFV